MKGSRKVIIESWKIHAWACMEGQNKHFMHYGRDSTDSLSLVMKSDYQQYQKLQWKQNQ